LIQFTTIDFFLGPRGIGNVFELHKCIVALHFNAHQFTIGFEEHAQIIALGGLFVKVHHEQRFRWTNLFAAIVFLSLDASVATSKFSAKGT
jgi:hypothetical protein